MLNRKSRRTRYRNHRRREDQGPPTCTSQMSRGRVQLRGSGSRFPSEGNEPCLLTSPESSGRFPSQESDLPEAGRHSSSLTSFSSIYSRTQLHATMKVWL